jgi:hypothetical protein
MWHRIRPANVAIGIDREIAGWRFRFFSSRGGVPPVQIENTHAIRWYRSAAEIAAMRKPRLRTTSGRVP